MLVAQLCLTLCDPLDCSPLGLSVHGILQARILEWVAIPLFRGFSWPREQTCSPALQADSYHLTYQGSQGSAYFSLNIINILAMHFLGFPGCVCGKESACQCRKCKRLWFNPLVRKIPWSRKWQNGDPLQYFCLENPMDRGAWQATVHGVEKSRTRLSNWAHTHYLLQRCVDTPY